MSNRSCVSRPGVISAPDGVIRTATLRASGVANSTITARCRPGGSWQRLAPGVLLLHNAPPNRRQLVRAALAYAGSGAVITGADALRARGSPLPVPAQVHVLIPGHRHVASQRHVVVERTTRMPTVWRDAGLAFSDPIRAVLDAARRETDPDRVRWLVTHLVGDRRRVLLELVAELDRGSQRGAALPRAVLREILGAAGVPRPPVDQWGRAAASRHAHQPGQRPAVVT